MVYFPEVDLISRCSTSRLCFPILTRFATSADNLFKTAVLFRTNGERDVAVERNDKRKNPKVLSERLQTFDVFFLSYQSVDSVFFENS